MTFLSLLSLLAVPALMLLAGHVIRRRLLTPTPTPTPTPRRQTAGRGHDAGAVAVAAHAT